MGFQFFWRIGHVSKPYSIFRRAQYLSFIALSLIPPVLHAETITDTNAAGDEIIIYEDDTFKLAPKDLAHSEPTPKETTPKAPTAIGVTPPKPNSQALDTLTADGEENTEYTTEIINVETDDLWQRIKNGYGMPDSSSALVSKHEQWYSSRPDYVKRMVERSQRYLFHIVEEVQKRDMPTEIALLPMIESAYNPQAYSTSRASGIWQFIPSTGKHFGLQQNWWVDNRRNIVVATDAALTYLQKLYNMFGAWDLALAAYNAGEGTVARAIEKNTKLGLATDYASLSLPDETRNYVPKLQAVKNLMTNPSRYGLNIQTIANTPYFAKVTAPKQIDARLAAKLAEISDEEFLALNPSYNRPVMTSTGEKHELLLPIVSAQTFRTNLANYNKPLVSWQTYFAKRGERLEKIASKFGFSTSQLREVNNLPAQPKIKKAATILVPNGNRADFTPNTKAANQTAEIAAEPADDITLTSAQQANNIDTDATPPNEPEEPQTQVKTITHTVKKGELLQSIAKRYGTTSKQIMANNGLKSSRIKAGQTLKITKASKQTSANASAEKTTPRNRKENRKQSYVVKRGDSLYSIAHQFDISVDDLKKRNKNASRHLKPGDTLTIAP